MAAAASVLGRTLSAENPSCWLCIGYRMEAVGASAQRVVLHLNAQRVRVAVDARFVVETLVAQLFGCKLKKHTHTHTHKFASGSQSKTPSPPKLTFCTALGQADGHRIVCLAGACSAARLADDVMQFDVTFLIAWRSDVHSSGCVLPFAKSMARKKTRQKYLMACWGCWRASERNRACLKKYVNYCEEKNREASAEVTVFSEHIYAIHMRTKE